MARLRKDFTGDRLTARITALLTPADRAALDEAAADLNITPSLFARHWILKGIHATAAVRALRQTLRGTDREIAAELTALGQPLNELAKRANETQELPADAPVEALARSLITVIDRIQTLPGDGSISDERRDLMNEIVRVGNNVQQLKTVARARQRMAIVAALDLVEERIVACVEIIIA